MFVEMKIRRVGGALTVILPEEAMAKLNVAEGDQLFLLETPDGSFRLTASNPEFERQMALARTGMRRYRNTLRELAK